MSQPNIVLFSTPTCSWCKKLKDYLVKKQLRFKEVDVSRDAKAAQDMVRKTGQQSVPQIWIGSTPVVGFDVNKIERLLNKN
jgi:glutaredoxin 3